MSSLEPLVPAYPSPSEYIRRLSFIIVVVVVYL